MIVLISLGLLSFGSKIEFSPGNYKKCRWGVSETFWRACFEFDLFFSKEIRPEEYRGVKW
jgi:hypothetical protein